MNRQHLFRGLRIAWSVGFGILCLTLICLWVRSYWWAGGIGCQIQLQQRLDINWGPDGLNFHIWSTPPALGDKLIRHRWSKRVDAEWISNYQYNDLPLPRTIGFRWRRVVNVLLVTIPFWFPLLVFATFAALPWLPWSTRFSLRTLLIVTTLVAVGLGLGVWATR
jgi:hypothetical protein